ILAFLRSGHPEGDMVLLIIAEAKRESNPQSRRASRWPTWWARWSSSAIRRCPIPPGARLIPGGIRISWAGSNSDGAQGIELSRPKNRGDSGAGTSTFISGRLLPVDFELHGSVICCASRDDAESSFRRNDHLNASFFGLFLLAQDTFGR